LDIKAGIAYYNESAGKFSFQSGSLEYESNNIFMINGVPVEEDGKVITKTGHDGPSANTYVSRTGFYVRKSMDEKPGGSAKASAVQSVRYRYGEVLLNAAEAAFELGLPEAKEYLKQVRDRAGIQTPSSINLALIRNERRVELAFEGHRFYDLKRWRTADVVFDGNINTPTAMIYGLYPFKVYRPDHVTHNKWIYVRRIPTPFTAPRKFVWANYYSSFSSDALTKNPKLIKNPGQ
jgi:hypothetical protein